MTVDSTLTRTFNIDLKDIHCGREYDKAVPLNSNYSSILFVEWNREAWNKFLLFFLYSHTQRAATNPTQDLALIKSDRHSLSIRIHTKSDVSIMKDYLSKQSPAEASFTPIQNSDDTISHQSITSVKICWKICNDFK